MHARARAHTHTHTHTHTTHAHTQLRAALLEVNVSLRAELLWDLLHVADGDGLVRLEYEEFARLVVGVLESSNFR